MEVGSWHLSSVDGDVREEAPVLRTKSVWSPINRKTDGLRILATRFRGRGMPTTRYDVWMPSLGPTEHTLRSVLAEPDDQESRPEVHASPAPETGPEGQCDRDVSLCRGCHAVPSPHLEEDDREDQESSSLHRLPFKDRSRAMRPEERRHESTSIKTSAASVRCPIISGAICD